MASETPAIATTDSRAKAWVLDAMLGSVLAVPATIGIQATLDADDPSFVVFLAFFVPMMLLGFGLLVYFDGRPSGATPGKALMGIRVADADTGGAIGFGRATKRRLMYVVGGLCFYLGFVAALRDDRRQAWHDRAANSIVVIGPRSKYHPAVAILVWIAACGVGGAVDAAIDGRSITVNLVACGVALAALVALEFQRSRAAQPHG